MPQAAETRVSEIEASETKAVEAKAAKTNAADQELADVVIAAKSEDRPLVPWYVTLRAWLFCLAFLLVAELATRVYFDTTLCLQKERFDNFPSPASENTFVAQMGRDTAYKIVTIGDSTVVGAASLQPAQSIPRYLEEALRGTLPGREIHVWNLSIAGARAPDMLCLLKKALEGKPDLVVINGNYYISALMKMPPLIPIGNGRSIPAKTLVPLGLAEPWLAYNLPEMPDSVRAILPPRDFKKRWEEELSGAIEDKSRYIGMRQTINAKVFGVQPRVPISTPNPLVMLAATLGKRLGRIHPTRWDLRGAGSQLEDDQYYYQGPITAQDANVCFYRAIMEEVRRSGVPCATYLTPQNPMFTRYIIDAKYRQYRQVLSDAMSGPGVAHQDLSIGLVGQELFSDNVHMLPEGNRLVAQKLAEQIIPFIRERAHVANRQTSASAR